MVFNSPSEQTQHLTATLELVETLKAERDKLKTARNRFCSAINNIAKVMGHADKQCYAPEAVLRWVAALKAERNKAKKDVIVIKGMLSRQAKTIGEQDKEIKRLRGKMQKIIDAPGSDDFDKYDNTALSRFMVIIAESALQPPKKGGVMTPAEEHDFG